MAVLRNKGELQRPKFEFLLHGPKEMGVDNPLGDWVSAVLCCAVLECGCVC
jgi:dynein heavy chain